MLLINLGKISPKQENTGEANENIIKYIYGIYYKVTLKRIGTTLYDVFPVNVSQFSSGIR